MVPALFIVSAIGLALAVTYGRNLNRRRARIFLRVLEEILAPVHTDYAVLGRELGYGFDYTLDSPIVQVQGVLTLLPRYTPLYLPIARLLGRRDLLKLTFHAGDLLPAGVGAVVHTNCEGSRWCSVERDEDWREETIHYDGREFTLFFYNPIVAERLRSIIPKIAAIEHINQIQVDSRRGTITVFVTPYPESIQFELQELLDMAFSLTAQ